MTTHIPSQTSDQAIKPWEWEMGSIETWRKTRAKEDTVIWSSRFKVLHNLQLFRVPVTTWLPSAKTEAFANERVAFFQNLPIFRAAKSCDWSQINYFTRFQETGWVTWLFHHWIRTLVNWWLWARVSTVCVFFTVFFRSTLDTNSFIFCTWVTRTKRRKSIILKSTLKYYT